MNLELIDPFEQDFPEVIEDTLEDGPAVTVKFNRRGTLLAAGCSDGSIVVWDFDTRGVSRSLLGHVKTITSLSWSRNGRYLLSSSRDWNCIVWDLLTGSKKHTVRFDTPVLNAQFHPKNK
ncbi:chromatin binding protein [Podila clonocystis]|nr:chromatin binding protein [Podila clonocystis]